MTPSRAEGRGAVAVKLRDAFRNWPYDAKDTAWLVLLEVVAIPAFGFGLVISWVWLVTNVMPALWEATAPGWTLNISWVVALIVWAGSVLYGLKQVWNETFRVMLSVRRFEKIVGADVARAAETELREMMDRNR